MNEIRQSGPAERIRRQAGDIMAFGKTTRAMGKPAAEAAAEDGTMVMSRRGLIAALVAGTVTLAQLPREAQAAEAGRERRTLRLAIISDNHLMPEEYNAAWMDFQNPPGGYSYDSKMEKQSSQIMDATVDKLVELKPDIILVPGDVSKDGEYLGCQYTAEKLEDCVDRLAAAGVAAKVYAVNGNHDVNNPNPRDYSLVSGVPQAGEDISVKNTAPAEFAELYARLGYGDDTERFSSSYGADGSLSYVVHPVEGLTVIAIDSCQYNPNQGGGHVGEELLAWVCDQAKRAREAGDTVIAMQHHPVLPHVRAESDLVDMLKSCDNWQELQEAYAAAGVDYLLTGHMHGSDVSSYTSTATGRTLYEIETPSLISYPAQFRMIELTLGGAGDDFSSTFASSLATADPFAYVDSATGASEAVSDVKTYSERSLPDIHYLYYQVVERSIGRGLDSMASSGGIQPALEKLLGAPAGGLAPAVWGLLGDLFAEHASVEAGLMVNLTGISLINDTTLSIWYDQAAGQLHIDQYDAPAAEATALALTDEQAAELGAAVAAASTQPAPRALSLEGVSLIADQESFSAFIASLVAELDEKIVGRRQDTVDAVDRVMDVLAAQPVDDAGHTLMDFVRAIFMLHFGGDEEAGLQGACAWAGSVVDALGTSRLGSVLNAVLSDERTSDALVGLAGDVALDVKALLKAPAGAPFMTTLVLAALPSILGTLGKVLDLVGGLAGLAEKLGDENALYGALGSFVQPLAYDMTHDADIPTDNEAQLSQAAGVGQQVPGGGQGGSGQGGQGGSDQGGQGGSGQVDSGQGGSGQSGSQSQGGSQGGSGSSQTGSGAGAGQGPAQGGTGSGSGSADAAASGSANGKAPSAGGANGNLPTTGDPGVLAPILGVLGAVAAAVGFRIKRGNAE